jgi:predicted ATPase/class 3 adenylate cyclase
VRSVESSTGVGSSTWVFVMTDVVGSTALWERSREAMEVSLELHDRIVGDAFTDAGGRVFKHTGDGMIAVFDTADAAVAGARTAVRGLADARWGETGPLEIRVAVHAGHAAERDGDFFGPPLNKTARINGVGHGGQVLVSDVVHQLMSTPAGIDLGEHQLRDLAEPIRLWQLDEGDHPPLRTLFAARHNLPAMATEFVGRRAEIDELRGLVRDHRLVTITGVGGCGKTRIAIEAAAAAADGFPGGVWFVDLTPERDPDAIGQRVLGAMGLVQPLSDDYADSLTALADATRDSVTLVVLDNCEHLVDDVAEVAERVLDHVPDVTVLATSREPLAVDGERVWRIPNLHDAAVELFLNRAAGVGVTDLGDRFDLIAQICGALDDIPLAIELAASQVASLSLEELSARLDDRFALLGGGRRAGRRRQRQQTLQTMMDWSYGLLSGEEQQLLRELSVFTGSFPLAGVEAIASPTSTPVLGRLQSLVEQSLVVPLREAGRYRLLETVRLYALDKLSASGAVATARNRHLTWIHRSFGMQNLARITDREALAFDERLLAEVENAFAALEWAEANGDSERLFQIFIGFANLWHNDNRYVHAALSWQERIPAPPAVRPLDRALWLVTVGLLRFNLGETGQAVEAFGEGASYLDVLRTEHADFTAPWSPIVFFRSNVNALMGEHDAALADADLLDEFAAVDPDRAAYLLWMAHLARGLVADLRGESFVGETSRAVEAVKGISRWAETIAISALSEALRKDGEYELALELVRAVLGAPLVNEGIRIPRVATGAIACAALGRLDEAVEIIGMDLGPMLEPQRRLLLQAQLTGLGATLVALGASRELERMASIALNMTPNNDTRALRNLWAEILDGRQRVESLPGPSPADLETHTISRLVTELITHVRALIAARPADAWASSRAGTAPTVATTEQSGATTT